MEPKDKKAISILAVTENRDTKQNIWLIKKRQ